MSLLLAELVEILLELFLEAGDVLVLSLQLSLVVRDHCGELGIGGRVLCCLLHHLADVVFLLGFQVPQLIQPFLQLLILEAPVSYLIVEGIHLFLVLLVQEGNFPVC